MIARFRVAFTPGPDLFTGTYEECHTFSHNYQLPKGQNQLPGIHRIEPMITALAPLGKTHTIQLVPDYDGAGNVTVTVLLKPKDKSDDCKNGIRHLSFKGPIAEVEGQLAEQLPKAVDKLITHANNLDQLDQELEAEEKRRKEEVEKAKAKPAPAPKPAKPEKTKKLTKAEKQAETTRKRLATLAANKAAKAAGGQPAPAPTAPTALTPAPKPEPAAPAPEVDFGQLFGSDEPAAAASETSTT